MKRILSLVLALMMLLCVASVATAEEYEPITVEIMTWEVGGYGNDAWADALEAKFNCEVVAIQQEWSDYQDKIRLLAASDTLPDCWAGYPVTESWYADLLNDEMIRSIPQEMLDKYPTLKAACEGNYEWNLSKQMYGDIYMIARPLSATNAATASRMVVYYRTDWAEALGYTEAPTDMEGLYNMLYDFAHKDPDGNGADDTYGLVGALTDLYAPFDAYPQYWVKNADGVSVPGYLDKDAMVAALTWFRKAYENKVIDPDFTKKIDGWTAGVFGAYHGNNDPYWVNRYAVEQFQGANPGVPFAIAPAFSAAPGATAYKAPMTDSSGTCFAYNTTDEELDRILAITDWLMTAEGNAFRYWGIEGEDYTVNADGTFTKTHETGLREKYPSIFMQNWSSWDHDFLADELTGDPSIALEIKQMSNAGRAASNAAGANVTKVDLLAYMLTTEEKQDFMFDYEAELTAIITGTEDVAAMYDAFYQKAYDAGVQAVIDSVNAAAANY